MPKKAAGASRPRLRVGQRVMIPSFGGTRVAEVIEDRGFIGVRDRQIVRVRTFSEMEELRSEFEVPAEEVIVVE